MNCPECEKMAAVRDDSQKLGDFLEWLGSKDYRICAWQEGISDADRIVDAFATLQGRGNPDIDNEPERGWTPINKDIEKILADYFSIDLKKVEEERRALLEEIRRK